MNDLQRKINYISKWYQNVTFKLEWRKEENAKDKNNLWFNKFLENLADFALFLISSQQSLDTQKSEQHDPFSNARQPIKLWIISR